MLFLQGKLIDKDLLNSLKGGSSGNPTPQPLKLRGKTNPRPRPKTIHIDSGADAHDGALTPSRGKKGSSSNLSGQCLRKVLQLTLSLPHVCCYHSFIVVLRVKITCFGRFTFGQTFFRCSLKMLKWVY